MGTLRVRIVEPLSGDPKGRTLVLRDGFGWRIVRGNVQDGDKVSVTDIRTNVSSVVDAKNLFQQLRIVEVEQ